MLVTAIVSALMLPVAAEAPSRTVTVVFVNHASSRTLTVITPDGQQVIGSFQFGGSLTVPIPVPDADVPVDVSWRAGRMSGSFTITSETADYLRIDLQYVNYYGPYPGTAPPRRRLQ
jgi:hypothetical protein